MESLAGGPALAAMEELELKADLACACDHRTTRPLPLLDFHLLRGWETEAQDKERNVVTFCCRGGGVRKGKA